MTRSDSRNSQPASGTDTRAGILAPTFGWIGLPLLLLAVVAIGLLPMTWQQQTLFGGLMVLVALIVARVSNGRVVTATLILLSMCATARYAIWRTDSLRRYFLEPWSQVNGVDVFFMLLLFSAELYSFVILYLGFMQTIAPLRRTPVPLPADPREWPTVDIMIPTFNEPLDVVRYTILAARQQDWPADKLRVWVLDDGNRQEFRNFAAEAGVGYVARPEHHHAKAGNINYSLARTSGDLVAIFDCDHVPTRSFLQVTTGWFLRDPKLGMLQTPHHFYSPDPFERNLGNFRRIPSESELFYGIIQDTNDLWNATFFCGSCAVLRRSGLDEVGGIAHETVTEDAHTSLRLQKRGWNTAYINLVQAAGLATETLADHVKQRVRWARGMIQILRVDNPLWARGLSLPQRLCYLNAMLHFLYALPRLIFLTAPILYLVFGKLNIPGYWLAILVFALPHLVLANIVNSRVQGFKRYSFWNEIYETVLSPYILLPTLFALISPKFGKFNVTAKGQNLEQESFDSKLSRPFLVLLALNALALGMAVPRYLWEPDHLGTVLMNVLWTVFNIVVLTVALSACWETRQRRQAVRVRLKLPVHVGLTEPMATGIVRDLSVSGGAMTASLPSWRPGDEIDLFFPSEDTDHVFKARIVGMDKGITRFALEFRSITEQEAMTRVLYLASDRWIDWNDGRTRDNILGSLMAVIAASFTGFRKMLRLVKPGESQSGRTPALARGVTVMLLVLAALFWAFHSAHAEDLSPHTPPHPSSTISVAFRALGAQNGILLNSENRNQAVEIALPEDVLVEGGTLHLRYTLPQTTAPSSTLEVLLNGALLASVTPSSAEAALGRGEVTVPLPPEQLVRENRITLQLASSGSGCELKRSSTAPIRIEADSDIAVTEQRLVLASDLSLLPAPFAERAASQGTEIPLVFAAQPSPSTLQAAGILASWFGSQSVQGETRFAVKIGTLPAGNAVIFLLPGEEIGGLFASGSAAPEIRTLPNPTDPYGKVLVLSAARGEDLVRLAQGLASGKLTLNGDRAVLGEMELPAKRHPDDAPRWIQNQRVSLKELSGIDRLSTNGENPINLYFRFAPDENFGVHRDMYLHLDYSDDATHLDPRSNIQVRLNGSPARSLPLQAGAGPLGSHSANVPLGDLPASTFGNTLQTQFYFVPTAGQECAPQQFNASLGDGSFLDMGAASHWATLPNLNLFSNAGFPFTRLADLSETAILLPQTPSPVLISEYLDLLSYFGRATGFPALRVSVGEIGSAPSFAGSDLMILGSFQDLAQMPQIASTLPLQLTENGWQLSPRAHIIRWADNLVHFLHPGATDSALEDEEIAPSGVLESIRSPFNTHRNAVLLLAKDDAAAATAMRDGLMAELPHDGIRGTVSLWQGGQFVSYNLSTPRYRLGDARPLRALALTLPDYPLTLAIVLLAVCVVLASWMQFWLAARIRRRLMGAPQLDQHFEQGTA